MLSLTQNRGTMLKINYKQVYEIQENKKNEWILIVYSISANHYVGVPIYSKENEKYLYLNYSLRLCDRLPCPLFCAHSTADTDVPYEEFLELQKKYRPEIFVASTDVHDFDRLTETAAAQDLLKKTLNFLERNI